MTEQEQIANVQAVFEDAFLKAGAWATMLGQLRNFMFSADIWPRFRQAPASSALSKHHAFDGGLLAHCVDVYDLAKQADPAGHAPRASIAAVAFLHDLHKIGNAAGKLCYVANMIKNGSVRSDKVPYKHDPEIVKFAGKVIYGDMTPNQIALKQQLEYLLSQMDAWPDGQLSLSLVAAYDPALFSLLNEDEKFSIRCHAGMYDRLARHELEGKETYLQMLMHFADMLSSRRNRWFGSKYSDN